MKGQLTGVFGRLGDLGWVPKEYDVAMSTAAFGGLNSILVEKYVDFNLKSKVMNQLRNVSSS